ncbi:hypothetical protein [Nonomuraea jabiensis]|uniref:Uncharacterized protein n=1 Tax=Nonomuraea jabiensis TaxID=882448 RepID=A0A7W9LIF8_9ACTN|nr:hypothetical protein [Nonomuraea jabiensis]MBB5784903.1 hypothetical protein [Nonomuraea jabiensis]
MNTESRQSRTPRHGRAATLTLAGAIVGSLLLPTGLAAAASAVPSSAAVPAGVGVISNEKPPLCGKHCGRRGWGGCWRPWCGPWGWGGWGHRHHRRHDDEIIRIRTPRVERHRPVHHQEPTVQKPRVKEEPVKEEPVKDDDQWTGREESGPDEKGQDNDSWWPDGDDWRDIFGSWN